MDEETANPLPDAPALVLTEEYVREQLVAFLSHNPNSSIVSSPNGEDPKFLVQRPWNDGSLVIGIPQNPANLFSALNNIYLPERYIAIWHRDTFDFEVLWTAHPLSDTLKDINSREFVFSFKSNEYRCEFSRSSDRALEIARNFQPTSSSDTQHRNLHSFNLYVNRHAITEAMKLTDGKVPAFLLGEPISFWIRALVWHEDNVFDLVNNLNFYMTYYDYQCPHIMTFPSKKATEGAKRTRYRDGTFPKSIVAHEIDDNLIRFWLAGKTGDWSQKFSYCYRVIEYAAFHYVSAAARHEIRKILADPTFLSDITFSSERVAAAVEQSKLEDYQKFEQLVRDLVEPRLLWREIEKNKEYFSNETLYDGGFRMGPIISATTSEEQYTPTSITSFVKAIREIRNALSHGRDQKTAKVIAPTESNIRRLQPWASLVSVAAGEVMLYKSVL